MALFQAKVPDLPYSMGFLRILVIFCRFLLLSPQTTQIIPLLIALCMYFEGKVTKICRKSPKFLKIPSNRANREPLPEKGPFLAVFGPFFQF
jgi:hypothetical protein